MKLEFDYVIAGGGSAGCALAARLSEDKSVSVCLIEAGGNGRNLFIKMPAGNGFVFGNPKLDWGYQSTPQKHLNGRTIYFPRGKSLGGSSMSMLLGTPLRIISSSELCPNEDNMAAMSSCLGPMWRFMNKSGC